MLQPKLNYALLALLLILASCKTKSKEPQAATSNQGTQSYQSYTPPATQSAPYTEPNAKDPAYYSDGVYCATVRYTNQNTQAQSIYMLNVEIQDGRLTKIHWPNSGWLDDSHFNPPHVNLGGFTTFVSDKGYEYDVLLKSSGGCNAGISNNYNNNTYSNNSSTYLEEEEDEETKLENKYGRYKAEVVKRISGCDYMILENNGDFYVVEWMGSYDPDEGDIIQGDLRSYGTETFYVHRRDRDTRLYVEDYDITLSRAWEIIRDKCNLDDEE